MAQDNNPSRYVKLTKERDTQLEDIRPGELNQPVHVPQLTVHTCRECGQPLPDSYAPPRDEPWTTGICGCAEDPETCCLGLFCPCILYGRNVERLREGTPWERPCTCHVIAVEGCMAVGLAAAIVHGVDPNSAILIGEGIFFAWWMCGIYMGLSRRRLQEKYHLQNSPCDPCMVHCCMHWCALCQEHREMQGRLSDNIVMPMTIINPPVPQEMHAAENTNSVSFDKNEDQNH
ncbi:hypothetical protein KI387_027023, partial [Taxus chinensis]